MRIVIQNNTVRMWSLVRDFSKHDEICCQKKVRKKKEGMNECVRECIVYCSEKYIKSLTF